MSESPRVLAVILNYNGGRDTTDAVSSLRSSDYPALEILVVDNASQDDSLEILRRTHADVEIVETGANLGFAEGCNVGLRIALERGADFALLVNDDVVASPTAVGELVRAMGPGVAATSGRVREAGGGGSLWAAGDLHERGRRLDDGEQLDVPREIVYGVGCFLLLSCEALRRVGLLDRELFLVHEEREWCLRATRAGFRIRYAPASVVEHRLASSFTSGGSPAYHYLFVRNELRVRFPVGSTWTPSRLLSVGAALFREIALIARQPGRQLARAAAAALGALHYLEGRFGPPPAYPGWTAGRTG